MRYRSRLTRDRVLDLRLLTLLALLIEALVGYPNWLWRAIGHPVSWIGGIIGWADRRFNRGDLSPRARRWRGALVLALLLLPIAAIATAVQVVLSHWLAGSIALATLSSSLFAQRSLHAHVAAVADALDRSLEDGRAAVAHIVGRDVEALDEAGVARAATESLAENFSDGIVAPAFWMALAGLPGIVLYKTINTADSMIGHRTPEHIDFGRVAARTDDVVNWPGARLSALLLVLAAVFQREASPQDAWRAVIGDARNHRSPNAGWPEAAMAGALGFRLAGPRIYHGAEVPDAYMGAGRAALRAQDIRKALALYRKALLLLWLLLLALFGLRLL